MVKYVLLFESESWFITPYIMRALSIFPNWVERWTYIWMFWCRNGRWEYPLIGEALVEKVMEPIGEYIYQQHISVTQ